MTFNAPPQAPRITPLRVIDASAWQGKPVPARQWLVPGVCVRGGATLLNGDGGVGKSLICMQLQTAAALGKPWLGLKTPEKGIKSLGLYCEDDEDELHRRQYEINKYYNCDFASLASRVTMMSRVGEDTNTLMSFSRRDPQGQVTGLFRQIEGLIVSEKIELVVIDTAADTFGGNEIDREQVRTFVQRLRAWAIKTNGSVLLTQHPSQKGREGSGESGSTAWHNSVRARVYLTSPVRRDEDGDEIPTNQRTLKFMKSNYDEKSSKLRLGWHQGVIKPAEEVPPEALFNVTHLREKLLDAACKLVAAGTSISPKEDARTALPQRARDDCAELKSAPLKLLNKIVEEMKQDGTLEQTTFVNTKGMKVNYLRPSWLRYPAEMGENP